jgi:hypothetical protein
MNPTPDYYKRTAIDPNNTVFLFENLDSVSRFIKDTEKSSTGYPKSQLEYYKSGSYVDSMISNEGATWFGTTNKNLVTNTNDTYLFNDKIDEFTSKFKRATLNVDVTNIDQNKTIKFTEKEVGIFSFDLASLGLIRVYEYWSPLLKRIVSGNFVRSRKVENGIIFYHEFVKAIPFHKVEYSVQYGGYYSNILKRVVSKDELIEQDTIFYFPEKPEIPQHDVDRKQQVDDQGRLKFSSTFKKSFIDIPKIEKELPTIDILVNSTYSAATDGTKEMIWSTMAALAIAEKLTNSGINYRIISFFGVSAGNPQKSIYDYVVVKQQGEPLDKNKIAYLLSDARTIRRTFFQLAVASQVDAGYENIVNASIGSVINKNDIIKSKYLEFLQKSENQQDRESAKYPNSKIVFSNARTEQQGIDEYNNIISQISRV